MTYPETTPFPDKGADLAASSALDAECSLRGHAGVSLVNHILAQIEKGESRLRRLTELAASQRRKTVEALLANLITATLHKFTPCRYVAVPFGRSAYTKLGLSCDSMVIARDTMLASGLIEYVPGFLDERYLGHIEVGRVSRLRATPALRNLMAHYGVDRSTVQRQRTTLIYLKRASKTVGLEPEDVSRSRDTLRAVNARLDAHDINLPEQSWDRLRERAAKHQATRRRDQQRLPYAGDPTAKALYRVFTREWSKGGRLYGGWWLNVPKEERRHLTIDGVPTVEIDFGHMHPALLYFAMGKALTLDPYALPPYSRELCKETFQRLINGSANKGGANLRRPKDFKPPDGRTFLQFVADYKHHLHEVADCFGKDVGLILQRGDSDLALAILEAMDGQGIVTLPIHDSFMVQAQHEEALYQTMDQIYQTRLHTRPKLKVEQPAPPGGPPPLLLEPVSVVVA